MIVITGGTGQLGGAVVRRLLERVPADQVGVSVRDLEKAQELQARGVRVRRGDFQDPASLADAFAGASRVLIVSVDRTGDEAVQQHRAAIDAAERAGVRRICYTSHVGSDPISPFLPMIDHAAAEVALRESGVPFTSFRNGFYASTAVLQIGAALGPGELRVPEDGPVSWTAHTDLAEAIAVALADDHLDAEIVNLTGPEAVDMAGLAQIAAELTGRSIRHVVVSDDEFRAGLLGHGLPGPAADMVLGIFRASRLGRFSLVDPTLPRLIGRSATPVRDVLRSSIESAG